MDYKPKFLDNNKSIQIIEDVVEIYDYIKIILKSSDIHYKIKFRMIKFIGINENIVSLP